MTGENPGARQHSQAIASPQPFGCGPGLLDRVSQPAFFFGSGDLIGNIDRRLPIPFVPALPAPSMPISFLKRYYSELMVGMGEVSQECRSVWQ